MAEPEAPYRWCVTCEEPVTLGPGEAVHAATGRVTGPDGHFVKVTGENPEMRRQADEIEAEYQVDVSVRFGFFRADRTDVIDAAHWEADDAEGLRRQLPARLRRDQAAPSGQGARQ